MAVDVPQWANGDVGHLQRAYDLTSVPIHSHRRVAGPPIVALKRLLRRLLLPVLAAQSGVNGANARSVMFLLRQLAAQERAIEQLQRDVAQLQAERDA